MRNSFLYQPIHFRSCYSLLRGVLTPSQICELALEEGAAAVGLADINGFYGLPDFYSAAGKAGLKPVIGMEIIWEGNSLLSAFCMDGNGFSLLNRMVTAMHASRAGKTEDDFDPLRFLMEEGWSGLCLASGQACVLERLLSAGRQGLFAALYRGLPFHSLSRWAAGHDIPLLALNKSVFRDGQDRRIHTLLRAVDKNISIEHLEPDELPGDEHLFVPGRKMADVFSALPEALENSGRLADEAEGSLLSRSFIFPGFEGFDDRMSAKHLENLCRKGIHRRYQFNQSPSAGKTTGKGFNPDDVEKRLAYELNIISRKGFAGYFLVVHDIVSRFPRTCGRGSSAASIVSYLLGITHVDPIKYNLFFERFLHEGRIDPPDIDVDFPWDEREQAMAYVFEKYSGRAGLVADHVTFSHRSCVREAARAFGFSGDETSGMISDWRFGRGKPLPGYVSRAAAALKGRPRYIGTHPGGVVITPGPITSYTHIQPGGTGFPVIAWEKDGTEAAGLVKIDLLGNRSLGVLRDSIELVNSLHEKELASPISWETFCPIGDAGVREFVETGDTLGIFYIESPATRQLLKKMGRGDYRNLVVASSIIRPAANRWINEFVYRLKGGRYERLPATVEEVLAETKGIMVYQEDVARVAIAAAGFSPSRADLLRKIMSKKDRELRLPDFRTAFMTGGRDRGITRKALEFLWEGILSFQGYSFCKAHSASYALVSYRLAWMKLHYPLEFFASVINNGGGFYSRQVYLNALRRRGFSILPPDVNKSVVHYSIDGRSLRVGLAQLKGISRPFLARLLINREKEGCFISFDDFISRMTPCFGEVRILIRAGALDSLGNGRTRPQLFWMYYHHTRGLQLFSPPVPPELKEYSDIDKVVDEVKHLDVIISRHPLEVFRPRIINYSRRMGRTLKDSRNISLFPGSRIQLAGTLVAEKEARTKNSRTMSFVSFEDSFAVFETVFFPDTYEAYSPVLERGTAFLITGKIELDLNVCQIRVEEILPLNR